MAVASAAEVVAVLAGIAGAVWLVTSAVRTVVIPRPDRVWLTATAFELARRVSKSLGNLMATSTSRHLVLGTFAPSVLISLPLTWSLGLIVSFASIFWGPDVGSLSDAVGFSGSPGPVRRTP